LAFPALDKKQPARRSIRNSQFDGKSRSYYDIKQVAHRTAQSLKSRNPNFEVVRLKTLQSRDATVVNRSRTGETIGPRIKRPARRINPTYFDQT
jgi:hypothetical protein